MATERIDIVVSERGSRTVKRNLEDVGRAGETAGRGVQMLQRMLQGLAVGAALTYLQRQADAYTNIQNKLRLVTRDSQNLARVNDELFASANRSRQGYEDTVTLFQKLALGTRALGVSQQDLLGVTESVNQAITLSGANTAQAQAAMMQFGQALAGGVMRAEEFNSIVENTPRLAQALADGIAGGSLGRLRQMVNDGQVSSAEVFRALQGQAGALRAEFEQMSPTIAGSFTVLQNNLLKFIGDLDQATGASAALARGILFLSNHLKTIAIVAGALGLRLAFSAASAAVMGVLGPMIALQRALGAASVAQALFAIATKAAQGAMRAFTASLLANPFTAILVAITALVVAIIEFGDEVKVTADGAVSLKDAFLGALSLIWDFVKTVAGGFIEAWNVAYTTVTGFLASFGVSWSDVFSFIGNLVKGVANFLIGAFVAAFNIIKTAWSNFPGFMDVLFTAILNAAISAAESFVNIWQAPLRWLAGALGQVSDEAGAGLTGFLDSTRISIPRAKLNSAGRAAAGDLRAGMQSAFGTDYVGDFVAASIERGRNLGGGGAGGDLSQGVPGAGAGAGAGDSGRGGRGRDGRDEETRADFLARVNRETGNSIDLARRMDFEWTRVNEDLAAIDERLIERWGEKARLSADERATMRERLKLMYDEQDMQRRMEQAYNDFKKPQEDYERGQEAINRVLREYPQYADEARRALRDLRIEYLQTKQDMASGLELGRLRVERDQENVGGRVADAYVDEFNRANQGMRELEDRAAALRQLMQDDPINSGAYAQRLRELGIEALQLRVNLPGADVFDALRGGLAAFVADFKGVLPGVQSAWANAFNRMADGAANALGRAIVYGESLGSALKDVARSALAELISALIKLGIQWLVMQVIGQTAQAAIGATGAAMGAATAAAWAPAAAAVSLATFGANAGPAMAGIATTYALTTALSAVKVPGFREGGYTGNVGRGDVAGVVHGQEFVVNAAATREHLGLLEALNAGRIPGYMSGGYVRKAGGSTPSLSMGSKGAVDAAGARGGDSLTISIDARGAESGVEDKIEQALDQALPVFLAKARKQEAEVSQSLSGRQRIGSSMIRRR